MTIEITKATDPLNEERWRFYIFDIQLIVLNSYVRLSRPSKRHNFIVQDRYQRIDQRGNTIQLDSVPWSEELEKEFKEKIFSMLKVVKKWDR